MDNSPEKPPPERKWRKLVRSALIVVVTGAILAAAIALGAWYAATEKIAGRSDSSENLAINILGHSLQIPANLVRFPDQRKAGPAERLDMAVHWPTMGGFTPERAQLFDDVSSNAPIVFVNIARRTTGSDSTQRLATIYAAFFADNRPSEHGLLVRAMRDGSGYGTEDIVFEPGSVRPFVARCYAIMPGGSRNTCIREIHLFKNLAMTYRFRRTLLRDWRQFDATFRTWLAAMGMSV